MSNDKYVDEYSAHPYPLGTEAIPLQAATKPSNGICDGRSSHQRNTSSISSLPSKIHGSQKARYQQIGSPSTASYLPKQTSHPSTLGDLSQNFNRRTQRLRLFVAALARFLITLVFIALFVVVLHSYQGVWVFREQGKNWFNAVMTGLAIAFGVHLAVEQSPLKLNRSQADDGYPDFDEITGRQHTMVLLGAAFAARRRSQPPT